ncbi:MAG: hypothetical protein COU98_00670 [Candidatus Staskawiczbacteria bacterium CG10_big_fil_rev_8_21_14_0_10_38_10]|uniref:General secretion pathway GspH domain-containing protein n=1 Tax=Candidatus Staskawiczbacteria bacterium CG10_big_fil_rev_8_21_14_0_10_38_10 TaxID=1974891 RepID=A0A2H9T1R3_9BACT|nr:MAG: hypothetical protein COU98_00670 [Candidatus Staskawiczbacteria bacterium CG10_big_fil_rev_8_21_14_0_10_38_10]
MTHSQRLLKDGFTLIEVLVVTSIIAIFTTIIAVSIPKQRQQVTLQKAAHKLSQDLKEVQVKATATEQIICEGGGVAKGFGMDFNQNYYDEKGYFYIRFPDCDNSHDYTPGDVDISQPGKERVYKNIYLEKELIYCRLVPDPFSVVFTPPSPTVTIDGSFEGRVIICLKGDNTKTKTVKINTSGLIEIE